MLLPAAAVAGKPDKPKAAAPKKDDRKLKKAKEMAGRAEAAFGKKQYAEALQLYQQAYELSLDPALNERGAGRINSAVSHVSCWVIPTDEERMVARHAAALLEPAPA